MSSSNQQSPEDMVANLGNMTAGMLEGEGGGALQGYEALQQQQILQGNTSSTGSVPVMPITPPQPRRSGVQDTSRTASVPVIPQSKLSEMFLRYGPEKDPNFMVSLFKLYPLKHAGDGGWVEDFHYPISEKDIRDRYPDGGRFQVVIKGSHPRTQQPGHVKEQVTVDVASTPQVIGGMAARRRRGLYDDVIGDNGAGYPRRRQAGMPSIPQQPPQVTVTPDNSATTMAFETLRDVLSSRTSGKDEMITQLRGLLDQPGRSGLDPSTVQSLIDANEAQKAAIASRHESQMTEERERATRDLERATSRLERQLDDERAGRNRAEEDSRRREEQIRERFEREITLLRTQLDDERNDNQRQTLRADENLRDTIKRMEAQHLAQMDRVSSEAKANVERATTDARVTVERVSGDSKAAVDRALEDSKQTVERLTIDHRAEVARLTSTHAEELKRVRHDLESRVELAERSKDEAVKMLERSKEDALAIERERSSMMIEQTSSNARQQMDSVTRQAETSNEHMRQMSEINAKAQEASAMTMRQNLEFQLQREQEDRRRAELDARKFRDKAEEAHDPISSLTKYKDVVDTVGSFFGTGSDEHSIIPHDEEKDTSIWGRVESLMDSRFGQRAGEIAGAIFASMLQRQQQMLQPGMPQPGPQLQQPMPPTPRQQQMPSQGMPGMSMSPQGMPQPGMTSQQIPMPQPQPGPTAGPAPTAAEVEAQIEEVLYGGPAGTQTGAPGPALQPQPAPVPQQPQGPQPTTAHPAMQGGQKLEPINAPNALDNALLRVKMWVKSIEDHIENGTPPERVVETLGNELPPEAIQGFTQFPVEVVIQEVLANGIENRGIISSEKGVAYLTEVQALLRKTVPK